MRLHLGLLVAVMVIAGACSGADSPATSAVTPPTVATTEAAATSSAVPATSPAPTGSDPAGAADCPRAGEELEAARLYIEHNATDEDTGIHGFFGGDGWRELCIWDPTGELVLVVASHGPLGELGLADLFFESREPKNDEFSIAGLLGAFPEGDYLVGGTDVAGTSVAATAALAHAIPEEPEIVAPELAEDEDEADSALVPIDDLVVAWEPVEASLTGGSVTITAYELIVTKVEHDDPDGWSRPVYDVHVGPATTSLPVPAGFLEPDTLYELEVLALEVSGNQTIALGFFTTAG